VNIIDPSQDVNRIVEKLKHDAAQRQRRLSLLSLPCNANGEDPDPDAIQKRLRVEIPPLRLASSLTDRNLSNYTLNDLLAFDDVEFLHNAYQALLKRPPDPDGLAAAIIQLRSGRADKLDILAGLRFSEEGREKRVHIRGLRWRTLLRRFCRLPLVRYLALPADEYLHLRSMIKGQRRGAGLILDRQDLIANYINSNLAGPLQQLAHAVEEALQLSAEQKAMNEALLDRVSHLSGYLDERVNEEAIQRQQETRDRSAEIEDLRRVYNKYRTQVELTEKDLKRQMEHLFRKHQEVKTELVYQQQRLASLSNGETTTKAAPMMEEKAETSGGAYPLDAFFASFDEHFRGNREDVKERLRTYIPILREHNAGGENAPILDVACGRGEWLELLKEEGLHARGVDVNSVLVAQCRDRGLDVTQAELVDLLRSIPDGTLGAVSAFHIVEHLPLERLILFLDEALRALRSNGLILLETPNPRNIMVGSCNFYFDPTHRNPLPDPVLRFLVESRGFIVSEAFGLNPSDEKPLAGDSEVARRFNDYFYGPMDYAIVARKV